MREMSRGSRYRPDKISDRLRTRVLLLYRDVVSGRWTGAASDSGHEFWQGMYNSLQHLYGRPNLSGRDANGEFEDMNMFLQDCSAGEFFDFIELSFKLDDDWPQIRDQVVEAINEIFKIENAPYQLTKATTTEEPVVKSFGRIEGTRLVVIAYPKVIRADDEAIHSEAIEPAMSVLSAPHFKEANLRFRQALDHYRQGTYDHCLAMCGTSLESVCKAICSKKRWHYSDSDSLSQVLKTVIRESDLETFYESPLMLIATIRNKLSSSHGKGTAIPNVKRHTAQFALNSTAAAILLLVHECEV